MLELGNIDIQTVSAIAYQYVVNAAFVYDSYVPSTIAGHYPNITSLAAGGMNNVIKSSTLVYKTPGGNIFIDFAKTKQCNCELYEDVVAPYFRSDMKALTWGRPLVRPYIYIPSYSFQLSFIFFFQKIFFSPETSFRFASVPWSCFVNPLLCLFMITDVNLLQTSTCLQRLERPEPFLGRLHSIQGNQGALQVGRHCRQQHRTDRLHW
jgi:hypothetical protein